MDICTNICITIFILLVLGGRGELLSVASAAVVKNLQLSCSWRDTLLSVLSNAGVYRDVANIVDTYTGFAGVMQWTGIFKKTVFALTELINGDVAAGYGDGYIRI